MRSSRSMATPRPSPTRSGRHHLIGLVRTRISDADLRARLAPALADALASRRPVGRVPASTLLAAYADVRRALAADGIDLLVLKGFYFAERLYGGIDRRPQHDLDVLVRPRDFRRTLAALRALGFARRRRDLHSIAVRHGDVQVDVHRHLRWAPVFAIDEAAVWRTALDVEVQGTAVRTLSDEYTLVFVLLAAFEDLGQGLAKLKQLLDVHLLLRAVDPTMDWEAFFARRMAENVLDVTVNVLAVCVALFEASDELPRLAAALADRASAACCATARRCAGSSARRRRPERASCGSAASIPARSRTGSPGSGCTASRRTSATCGRGGSARRRTCSSPRARAVADSWHVAQAIRDHRCRHAMPARAQGPSRAR
jgi:hypothetical protein